MKIFFLLNNIRLYFPVLKGGCHKNNKSRHHGIIILNRLGDYYLVSVPSRYPNDFHISIGIVYDSSDYVTKDGIKQNFVLHLINVNDYSKYVTTAIQIPDVSTDNLIEPLHKIFDKSKDVSAVL